MPEWLASFHMPKFSDAKFEVAKEAYNKKHGYTVAVPSLQDVIHLKPFSPLTEIEEKAYKERNKHVFSKKDIKRMAFMEAVEDQSEVQKREFPLLYETFPDNAYPYKKPAFTAERLREITEYKARMREKYLNQLGSASPKLLRQAGAILTSLDDLQDVISTAACIGMIAAAVIGGSTAALLSGPLGWMITATTLLNMLNPLGHIKGAIQFSKGGRERKRMLEKFTNNNPFSKKARLKTAKNIKNFMPHQGNVVEALQVTDQIFGFGISIGPLMGFAQDMISGIVRGDMGETVKAKMDYHPLAKHARTASRGLTAANRFMGIPWKSNVEDEATAFIAANLCQQVMSPYFADFNALAEVDGLANFEIKAPACTSPIIREIIEEAGHSVAESEIWPQNGSRWITYGELSNLTAPVATENLRHFSEVNKNSNLAFVGAQNAHDFALNLLTDIEGPGSVVYEFSHTERAFMTILQNGWEYPKGITQAQIAKFEEWISVHEYMNTQPTGRDIMRYAETWCGFSWAKSPEA